MQNMIIFFTVRSSDVEYEDPGGLQEKLERLNQVAFQYLVFTFVYFLCLFLE